MFYGYLVAVAVIVGLLLCWPLVRMGSHPRNYALAFVLLLPIATLALYQQVGSPDGIGVSGSAPAAAAHPGAGAGGMEGLVEQLELRLQENPADLEGWVLLGRSYKTMQRYDQAEAALLRAYQMAPDDPLVMVELAEARLFTSGEPKLADRERDMLQRALAADPEQQKALWLLGLDASQRGLQAEAVDYWQKLLAQVDPASPVAASVQAQIDRELGRTPAPPEPEVAETESGIPIRVELASAAYVPPQGAVLFVIARDADAPTPPLGAKRIAAPSFPLELTLTDGDSMMAQRPISAANRLQLVARLSMSGSPVAGKGDLESAPVAYEPGDSPTVLRIGSGTP